LQDNKSIFLLAGDEEFLKEEWIQKTRQRFVEKAQGSNIDFNLFYAGNTDISGVVSLAKTSPFLAKKRLIVLKNIEALTSSSLQEPLLTYSGSPSSHTVLVLETDTKEKLFPGNKFLSKLGKNSQIVFFKKLYDRNLLNWISRRFLINKKKIAPPALELLKELKGNDLKGIDAEVEKLTTYVGNRPLVTLADVQQLVGNEVASSIYEILDAISQKNQKRALALGLSMQKKDLSNIIGLFCWNLRNLLKVREGLRKGYPLKKISDELELRKFQLDRFVAQAKGLKVAWIKTALLELAEFDLEIKTNSLRGSLFGWQMLLVRLLAAL